MRRSATALTLVAALTLSACGSDESSNAEPADWAETTTETQSPRLDPVELTVEAPSTTYSDRVTIRGTASRGADVTIDGHGARVTAAGRWSRSMSAERGANSYVVSATLDGHEMAEEVVEVTRRRTQAQIAEAIARREAAQAARRERAAARRAAAAQEMMREEAELVDRIANGSGETMTSSIAKEIVARCETGAVTDFDVCFEAGYVAGKGAAESTIDKYE